MLACPRAARTARCGGGVLHGLGRLGRGPDSGVAALNNNGRELRLPLRLLGQSAVQIETRGNERADGGGDEETATPVRNE